MAEPLFAENDEGSKTNGQDVRELRRRLRHNNGLCTRWQPDGLHCECLELANGFVTTMKLDRKVKRGGGSS